MELTLEQIQQCAVGALSVTEENGRIRFHRMTEALAKQFGKVYPIFEERAHCTTDVRISFYTDSRHLRADVFTQCTSDNSGGKYEIFVNNNPYAIFRRDGSQRLVLDLPEGEKLVSVYLPGHNIGMVDRIELDEGSCVRKPDYDKKFLFLGDSITQGYSASHDALSFSNNIANFFRADSLNWAVGGSCFDPNFLEKTTYDPDVVFVAYGTNDYTTLPDMDTLQKNCAAYLDKLQQLYGDKKVFCLSPIWRKDGELRRGTGILEDCRRVIISEIEKHGFIHIDGMQLCPHSPEYFEDGYLHPNDMGFAIYTQNLIRLMLPHM